ncbi:high mobility group [Rhizoctonia solani]|uniref:High mobility group n=1 Tax=Rhizoctonia solani TaxID=456999 RepID=A0A8H7M0N6_9AGAM|nr:high mobility group [Rhizoctonia solani]
MASSDRQPEGPSIEEFEEKQAELVGKLTEISTSMRQCADIFDSFTRFRPLIFQRIGSADRSDPPSTTAQVESIGSPSNAQGTEGYRRSTHSYPSGPMLPPAVPTFHAAGLSGVHPSLASMHSSTGHSPYPSQRPSSAASGTGSGGVRETGIPSRRGVGVVPTPSEHHTSSGKHAKRKRHQPTDTEDYGDESEVDTGLEGSPQLEAHEAPSESDQPLRRPLKRGRVGVGAARNEDRLPQPATGPSIVVFSSGPGSSKSRALHSRGPVPVSTRNRKEKKPKDPNAPKQPPPAYIVYQNEIRESMRARFPTHSPTELVKEIAATWKTLSNSERQRYKDYANIEKDRWVAELAAYQASISNSEEGQKGSEGTFLATTGVSDSPPGSSLVNRRSHRMPSQTRKRLPSGKKNHPGIRGTTTRGANKNGAFSFATWLHPIALSEVVWLNVHTPSGWSCLPWACGTSPVIDSTPEYRLIGFRSLVTARTERVDSWTHPRVVGNRRGASVKTPANKDNTPPEEKEDADSGRPAREGQKTG